MEIKMSIGVTSCGEKFLSLLGRMYSGDEQICNRISDGLLRGDVEIEIVDDKVSFAYEGMAFEIKGNREELSHVKKILKTSHKRLEPKEERSDEGCFAGFQLLFG